MTKWGLAKFWQKMVFMLTSFFGGGEPIVTKMYVLTFKKSLNFRFKNTLDDPGEKFYLL
jgi:hypothetical protein